MTNLLSICLVLTTLLAAEIWSPPIPTSAGNDDQVQGHKEDVIVKEGHRVVVVETFDDQVGHHNTKISISPNKDQPATEEGSAKPLFGGHSPGELVCDSLGKCTHKMAKAFGDAKDRVFGSVKEPVVDTVSGAAHQAAEKASDLAEGAKQGAYETAHQATEKASELAHGAKETVGRAAHQAQEKATETKERVVERASDTLDKGKETAYETAQKAREAAKGVYSKTKDSAGEVKDIGKTIGNDVTHNVSQGVAERTRPDSGSKRSKARAGAASLSGVLSLLGLATAYGTSVWVTFISSYVLANVLPRQQFGVVQSKVYPVYFQAMGSSIGLALLGHLLGRGPSLISAKSDMLQALNLVVALGLVAVNAIYVEPLATKAMFERMRIEKEEGRGRGEETQRHQMADAGPAAAAAELAEDDAGEEETRSKLSRLNARVKNLNSLSSWLNILTLMGLTWHLVHLGYPLHAVSS